MSESLYDLSSRLDGAITMLIASIDEHEKRTRAFPDAERTYRAAKSKAFLAVRGAKNVAEREALAESSIVPDPHTGEALTLGDIRYQRDLAEGLKFSSLEAQRSYRAVLSAIQSLASLSKAEAEFARVGPGGA